MRLNYFIMVNVIYYEHLCDFPNLVTLDIKQEITLSNILQLLNIDKNTIINCLCIDNQFGYTWKKILDCNEILPMCDGRIILKFSNINANVTILEQTFKPAITVDDLLDFNFDNTQPNIQFDVINEEIIEPCEHVEIDVCDRKVLEEQILKWSTKNGRLIDIRNLLINLENVLWYDERWTKVHLVDILDEVKLKIVYRKALQIVHPDKCVNKNKEIAQLIFDKLLQARNIFNDTNIKKL